jgi:3-hydroxyisobutyrate dehydrogenase
MNDWSLKFDLTAIDEGVWQLLQQAVGTYKAPFHNAVIATVNGDVPDVRTVVLRRVVSTERTLFFHTDTRSPKIKQLQEQPMLTWLFYDAGLRMQLRCYARAVIHTNDAVADFGWEHARLPSKLCYTLATAPGTLLDEPDLIDLNRKEVEPELLETARSYFAVVETKVDSLDWVFLHHQGNRRAYFDYLKGSFQWKQM